MKILSYLILVLVLCRVTDAAPATDWPQQGGPNYNFVTDGTGLAGTFPGGKVPVLWKANVGFGSAPAVEADHKLYVFGLFKPGVKPDELDKPDSAPTNADIATGTFMSNLLPGNPPTLDPKAGYPPAFRGDLYARCLDAATGKQVWACKLTDAGIAFRTTHHSSTAWEVASPLLASGKLYIHTHTGWLYAVDAATGKLAWSVNLFEHGMGTWYGGQQGNSCAPLMIDDTLVVSYEGPGYHLILGAFDPTTGSEMWKTTSPLTGGMNLRTARLGFATIDGQPTVLCSCAVGTLGMDPLTGQVLWSYDWVGANADTMKQVPAKYASDPNPKVAKDYQTDALRPPFPGYAPQTWQNYVLDAACVGHNSLNSAIWCLKIEKGKPTLAWQTHDVVPQSASVKSHMIADDGKLYVFDSYFPGFKKDYVTTRPYRGPDIGQFQCLDIPTGKRLWSTNVLTPGPTDETRVDATNNNFLIAGSTLILCNENGLSIGTLNDKGVTVLAQVKEPADRKAGCMLAPPILADGILYVRQLYAGSGIGLAETLGGDGNLFALDLRGTATGSAAP